jgi:4-hydroxybenzoate polyprenyltransferase
MLLLQEIYHCSETFFSVIPFFCMCAFVLPLGTAFLQLSVIGIFLILIYTPYRKKIW